MDFHFLIASERSGSNLITKMLDAHPHVCGPSPLHILRVLGLDHFRYGLLTRPNVWDRLLDDMLQLVNSDFAKWAVSYTRDELVSMARPGDLPGLLHGIYEKEARANGKNMLFLKELWVYRYLPFLDWCFPGAKYVYLVRDPRDMALSWRDNSTHPGGVVAAARTWLQDQRTTLPNFGTLYNSGRGLLVRYEDLLTDSEGELRRIAAFLGLEYSPAMLKYHENKLTQDNAEKNPLWQNLSKEVMSDNFNKFKKGLSEQEIAAVEKICWGNMQYFAYQPVSSESALKAMDGKAMDRLAVEEQKKYKSESNGRVHDAIQMGLRKRTVRFPKN